MVLIENQHVGSKALTHAGGFLERGSPSTAGKAGSQPARSRQGFFTSNGRAGVVEDDGGRIAATVQASASTSGVAIGRVSERPEWTSVYGTRPTSLRLAAFGCARPTKVGRGASLGSI